FAGINGNDLIVKIVKKYLGQKYPKFCLKYLGKLNDRMLITQMLESDIYVMPSHIENSPNNLCEAMMLGMPCIASFSGGTSSMLNNKVEGVLIQDGDPWVLAGAILDYINKKEKYIEYGINAYKGASKRHKINNIVSNLIKNYSQIISFV
ncbi:MAG TPA: glycosyltransferase, partial [Tenuifilum sp.]|uniref:glycosyltransferase n=1 Tax=Tenuifilum sp. TaxID=2760880 RepID=UPI002BE8E3D6|nr:glycosyltransferase [Tenuifilum sp.]